VFSKKESSLNEERKGREGALAVHEDYYDMMSDFQRLPAGPTLSDNYKQESVKILKPGYWKVVDDYLDHLNMPSSEEG
jgi:hypothetical protein